MCYFCSVCIIIAVVQLTAGRSLAPNGAAFVHDDGLFSPGKPVFFEASDACRNGEMDLFLLVGGVVVNVVGSEWVVRGLYNGPTQRDRRSAVNTRVVSEHRVVASDRDGVLKGNPGRCSAFLFVTAKRERIGIDFYRIDKSSL